MPVEKINEIGATSKSDLKPTIDADESGCIVNG
jgi:hypothetical protein